MSCFVPFLSTLRPPLGNFACSVSPLLHYSLTRTHPRSHRFNHLIYLVILFLPGDLASVEDLLAQGEDVNSRGAQNRTPLHRAVGKGHNAVVQQLIRQGADLSLIDQGGLTPLSGNTHTTQHSAAGSTRR